MYTRKEVTLILDQNQKSNTKTRNQKPTTKTIGLIVKLLNRFIPDIKTSLIRNTPRKFAELGINQYFVNGRLSSDYLPLIQYVLDNAPKFDENSLVEWFRKEEFLEAKRLRMYFLLGSSKTLQQQATLEHQNN
jgi:hypothetical protein